MAELNVALISEAVVAWTGKGRRAWPNRDESHLIERYGPELAVELIPVVKRLKYDFYATDARHRAANLTEVAEIAESDFRAKHPEILDEAVEALSWCYTFDFK